MIALLLFAGLRRSEVAAITLNDLDRIHSPIDLGVGAETTGGIVVSVAAERVAVRREAG